MSGIRLREIGANVLKTPGIKELPGSFRVWRGCAIETFVFDKMASRPSN